MPNYDERQNLRADYHSNMMNEQRYKQLDQQIEAEMTRSEYDAMSQLADSKEDVIRDGHAARNKQFELNEQLRRQRATEKLMSFLTNITIIGVLLGLTYITYNTFL